MNFAYLGNHSGVHGTERHVSISLEQLGHDVLRLQQGVVPIADIAQAVNAYGADVFVWTHTFSRAEPGGTEDQMRRMLRDIDAPTVGLHIDRFWGLSKRQSLVESGHPFFAGDYLFTADGGHPWEWERLGINHHWLPPGVFADECYDGTPQSRFTCDVAFVGAWQSYGHPEWREQRMKMLEVLRSHFGQRFGCFPTSTSCEVRGTDLTDLYASAKVIVGDSCLSLDTRGEPIRNYWSDRIPDATGRGGFVVHPFVEGLADVHPDLATYELGDLDGFVSIIERFLEDDDEREALRVANTTHTRLHHTYRHRMASLIEAVCT